MRTRFLLLIIVCLISLVSACKENVGPKIAKQAKMWVADKALFSYNQNRPFYDKDCMTGRRDAHKDAENGIYTYTRDGLFGFSKEDHFHSEYVKDKYNVQMRSNCNVEITGYQGCYQQEAISIIFKKYGNDFIKKTQKEAEILFNKQN